MITAPPALVPTPLGDFVQVSKGTKLLFSGDSMDGTRPRYIQIDDLRNDHDLKYAEYPDGTEVVPSDLVIVWDGANSGEVAYGLTGLIGSTLARLRPVRPIHTPYLARFLQSQVRVIRDNTTGATIPHVSRQFLERIEVPIPFPDDPRRSLAEQKRIAAILDKADAIRRRRQEALTELAELPRSAFLDLLGDPALNPMGWPVVPLAESFSQNRPGAKCGPFGTALSKAEYTSSGIPVYGIDNVLPNRFREDGSLFITPDKFNDLRAYSVEDGDVLISRAGTVGRMCVARPKQREAIIGTNLIRVALNPAKMMPEYMSAVFTYFAGRLPGLRSSSDEDAYSFMKTGVLERLSLPTPDIGQQRKYAGFVRSVDLRLSDAEMRRKAADTLFDSLVQRAFRAEL